MQSNKQSRVKLRWTRWPGDSRFISLRQKPANKSGLAYTVNTMHSYTTKIAVHNVLSVANTDLFLSQPVLANTYRGLEILLINLVDRTMGMYLKTICRAGYYTVKVWVELVLFIAYTRI